MDQHRAKVEKWVETRQVISRERADWRVEEEYLKSTRKLLRQERDAIRAEIDEYNESNSGAGEERRELLLQRGDYQRTMRSLEGRVGELEREVVDLVPSLPAPLQEKLEILLVQIPEDPENAEVPLGQRLMNVLGVLAQAEKFNSTATFVGETRDVGDGNKVQVRTLYWGLGHAVYVDAQGNHAGIARPSETGWHFSDEPDLVDRAKLLLDIYEGNVDTIAFVPLPVEIR